MHERLEEHVESGNYLNESDAIRALLRDGLEANKSDDTDKMEEAVETVTRQQGQASWGDSGETSTLSSGEVLLLFGLVANGFLTFLLVTGVAP
jgi:Arc/MetJ-type ribon-helix-helix transcriptional regulator